MDQSNFKALLVRDQLWLEELYSTPSLPNRKRLLNSASDKKLDTLLKFLHLLTTGEIKMHKKNFDALEKSKLRVLRRSFESKASIKRLLKSERLEKLKPLQKICSVLPILLYTLFNPEEN